MLCDQFLLFIALNITFSNDIPKLLKKMADNKTKMLL